MVGLACASLGHSRRLAVLLALLAHGLYLASVGGDELPEQRFLVPVAPLLFSLGFLGAEDLLRRAAPAGESRTRVPVGLPCTALLLGGLGGGLLPGSFPPRMQSRAATEHRNVQIGLLLRENTSPDASVAHFWAGAAPYFSERRGVDFLGKCDPVIARQKAHPGLFRPGHNKYDFDHSLALEPDVVVSGLGGLVLGPRRDLLEAWAQGPYRAFVPLYSHPVFQQLYLENLVGRTASKDSKAFELSMQSHGIFVRDGTPRAKPAPEWKDSLRP